MMDPSTILPELPQGADVCVIRLRSLGDMILSTPALAALHQWRPDLRISVLAEAGFAPVLEGNPAVSEVLIRGSFTATARMLRRRRFQVVFNQHGGPTSAFLTRASGSPLRVSWRSCRYSLLYNVLVPGTGHFFKDKLFHTVQERVTQFYWTGLPRGPIPPATVYPQPDAEASVRSTLDRQGVSRGEPYAVIHPSANYDTKVWSLDGFREVACRLRREKGIVPVVVLGTGDHRLEEGVHRCIGPHGVIINSFDLRELIALMAGAHFFLGNDSGPAHVAAAAGKPAVVIFGSSSSARWRPWMVPHRVVENDYSCKPCPGKECTNYDEPRCIRSISVQQVWEACEAVLSEAKKPERESGPEK